jgi:chromosome segregation ATPase
MLHYAKEQGLSGKQVGEMAKRLYEVRAETGISYVRLVNESERLAKEKVINEEKLVSLRDKVDFLEEEKQRKLEDADTTEAMLQEYLDDKKKLEAYSLDVSSIGETAKVLKSISELGYDTQKVIKLIMDYGSLTAALESLDKKKKEAEEQVKNNKLKVVELEKKRTDINENIVGLESRYRVLRRPLDALNHLLSNGVLEDDIIEVKALVDKAGYTVDTLLAKMESLGSLNHLIEERRKEARHIANQVKRLKEEKKSSEEELEHLIKERARVRNETNKILDEQIEWVKETLNQFKADINDPETGLSHKIKEALDGSLEETTEHFTIFKKEALLNLEDVNNKLNDLQGNLKQLQETTLDYGIEIGRSSYLSNLAKLFSGKTLSTIDKKLVITTNLEQLSFNLEQDGFPEEAKSLRSIRDIVLQRY